MSELDEARETFERVKKAHKRALDASEVARNWSNELASMVAQAEDRYLKALYGPESPEHEARKVLFGPDHTWREQEIITLNHDKQGEY